MKSRLQVNSVLVSILDSLGDACLLLNDKRQIILYNQKARELFALPEGNKILDLEEVISEPKFLAALKSAPSSSDRSQQEFILEEPMGSQGGRRSLAVSVGPIHATEPGSPCVRLLIRDETDRQVNEQLRNEFVFSASQELRTPLTIINGYLENLVDGVVDEPSQVHKCLLTMRRHGETIARIVEDMLTLTKFESGHEETDPRQMRRARFSLGECLSDVLERLHPSIEASAGALQLDIATDADSIAGDRFYWDQILYNILENAIKRNGPGLTIQVRARRESHQLVLTITDHGKVMPAPEVPFVLHGLHSGDGILPPNFGGAGLSLFVARRAVEAHGGSLSLESIPGVETTFKIVLPDVEFVPGAGHGSHEAPAARLQTAGR